MQHHEAMRRSHVVQLDFDLRLVERNAQNHRQSRYGIETRPHPLDNKLRHRAPDALQVRVTRVEDRRAYLL